MVFGGTGQDHGVQDRNGTVSFPIFLSRGSFRCEMAVGPLCGALTLHRERAGRHAGRWEEALSEVANLSGWDLCDR